MQGSGCYSPNRVRNSLPKNGWGSSPVVKWFGKYSCFSFTLYGGFETLNSALDQTIGRGVVWCLTSKSSPNSNSFSISNVWWMSLWEFLPTSKIYRNIFRTEWYYSAYSFGLLGPCICQISERNFCCLEQTQWVWPILSTPLHWGYLKTYGSERALKKCAWLSLFIVIFRTYL